MAMYAQVDAQWAARDQVAARISAKIGRNLGVMWLVETAVEIYWLSKDNPLTCMNIMQEQFPQWENFSGTPDVAEVLDWYVVNWETAEPLFVNALGNVQRWFSEHFPNQ
jgi:hypothetical protein